MLSSRWGVPVILLAAACLWPTSAARAKDESPGQQLAAKLLEEVDFPGLDDNKATLLDALDNLRMRHKLTFDVDEEAFKAEEIDDVLSQVIGEKPLPKMFGVQLQRLLAKILSRVNCPSGATYWVRRGAIEITTTRALHNRVWGPSYDGPFLPLVYAAIEKRSLRQALKDLADTTDFNIVVDESVAEKTRVEVSATLRNVPLDTAVRILTDMAGLRSTLNDNVLYVTAADKAVKFRPVPEPVAPAGGPGGALDGPGVLGGYGGGLGAFGALGGGVPAFGAAGGGFGLVPNPAALLGKVANATFVKRPVQEALEEVLKPSGFKLVVDTDRVGDNALKKVTTNLDGVRLQVAVILLANMADLQPVFLDNVVYLTTKENARSLHDAEELIRKKLTPDPPLVGPGGVPSLGGAALPGK